MSNLRKASGPKTAIGKRRSRHNARKHGLAAVLEIEDYSAREAQLEAMLTGDDADRLPWVKKAVEHRVEVERVVEERAVVVRALVELSAKAEPAQVIDKGTLLSLLGRLTRLQRYEKRALGRWLKSVGELIEHRAQNVHSTGKL